MSIKAISSVSINVCAGAIFGAALLESGVYSPSVIVSQMRFHEFHMLKVFFGASACSVIVVSGAHRTGYLADKARSPSSYGWFGTYDANLVGGLLIGAGMAITGSCPGTALVQVAAGIQSGVFVVLGGILGAMLFSEAGPRLRKSNHEESRSAATPNHTVQSKLGIGRMEMILAYEAACVAVIALTSITAPGDSRLLNPILGAVLLGVAQAVSVVLRFKTVGVSTAYADVSQKVCETLAWRRKNSSWFTPSVQFAMGILAGSAILADYVPLPHEEQRISNLAATFGGLIMVFGARLADGCPSGHGISGLATFSLASFVTVAAIFAGGIGTALAVDAHTNQILH